VIAMTVGRRMSNPIAWSAADKCLLAWLLTVALTIPCGLLGTYQTRHPEMIPYVDLDFATSVALPFVWSYSALGVAMAILALLLRRRHRELRGLVYVTTSTICLGSGLTFSWMFGHFTSPMAIGLLVTIAVLGSILFDLPPMLPGLGLWLLGAVAITIAERSGLMRYAPLFVDSPVRAGRLSTAWILGWGGISLALVASLLVVAAYLISRWHRQEALLAETSQQLARANDVISRYVASQLVEEIRAGHYEEIARHDRRKLTLFFSDIKDFAALADAMEPEDLSNLLNEYLSEMAVIGQRFGATIDKFVGDAIMIFFGAPAKTDERDGALRATQMAIAMQRRMRELHAKWLSEGIEQPFVIRIGINTGQATVGAFGSPGRMDYTAIGRQVNLAARLQSACEPGGILLSHSTWVYVQDEVACAPRGEIDVKGFHLPVKVYEVTSEAIRGARLATPA
jgi:adenylate cyclase